MNPAYFSIVPSLVGLIALSMLPTIKNGAAPIHDRQFKPSTCDISKREFKRRTRRNTKQWAGQIKS